MQVESCQATSLPVVRSCENAVSRRCLGLSPSTTLCAELKPLRSCDLTRQFITACPLAMDAVPPQIRWQKHGSCAIVSSSGSLRGSGCGAAIDRHDAVFRFNLPRISSFENDVGRRTTLLMINEFVVNQLFARRNETTPLLDSGGAEVLYARSLTGPLSRRHPELTSGSDALQDLARRQLGGRNFLTPTDTPLPTLGDYPAAAWFASLNVGGARPTQERHHLLSTGMRGLLLAAATCRSITPFGFSSHDGDGPRRNRTFHYWEAPRRHSLVNGAENISFEHVVIDALRSGGEMRVCLREKSL